MDISENEITILVKVVGPGSRILAFKETGHNVDISGPMGGVPFNRPDRDDTVFVAGGTGLGPIIFCARNWKRQNYAGQTHLFIGAHNEEELLQELYAEDFSFIYTSTIDGSAGFKGNVVELLEKEIETGNIPLSILYSCGPRPMLRALIDKVDAKFDRHLTSLESVMACGVGACRGCTVPVVENGKKGLRAVCLEGTVFRSEDIDWGEWE